MSFSGWWRRLIGEGKKEDEILYAGERIVTDERLEKELREIWPYLIMDSMGGNLWAGDPEYYLPSMVEVEAFLHTDTVDRLRYLPRVRDCEDFGLLLVAHCREYIAEQTAAGVFGNDMRSWAIAEAWGSMWHGEKKSHGLAMVRTYDQGWRMIEPQRDTLWTPTYKEDRPYFVKF